MLFAPSEFQNKNTSMPVNALADMLKMAYPALQTMGDENARQEISNLHDLFAYLEHAEQFIDEDIATFYHTYLEQLREVIYGSDSDL